jgi:hypothetical protein
MAGERAGRGNRERHEIREKEDWSMKMKMLWIVLVLGVAMAVNGQEKQVDPPSESILRKFDLEFHGGPVKEFVAALNEPLEGGLNIVIPEDARITPIPAMKLRNVNVAQVFEAVSSASRKTVRVTHGNRVSERVSAVSFLPVGQGILDENTVWAFHVDRPAEETQKQGYRFYQLGPYLEGLKIEDITTAIQTALKMLKAEPGPELKFHPETKLLIAVGQPEEFQLIDDVLMQIPKGSSKAGKLGEVSVNGAVRKPGTVSLPTNERLTIVDAIGRAGGRTASPEALGEITFKRPGQKEMGFYFQELEKENDPSKVIYLQPGDVIEVRK